MSTKKIIGIDLGTTNSCVAILEGGQPTVIANAEGFRTTPSVVGITRDGERLVGELGKRQAVTNPRTTVVAVKRLMGRRYDTPEVKMIAEGSTVEIVAGPDGGARVKVHDQVYSPEEVSSMVLSKMKETAEDYLGESIDQAIITVPAYFDDSQRHATKNAGKIAGLEVLRIINEPTAAALAYGLGKDESGTIAVYDLGGGTFDISILEVNSGVFDVRSTAGDTFLGGEDFDRRVMDWMARKFKDAHGIDLLADVMSLQRLKDAAEKAKKELSSTLQTEIKLPFIAVDKNNNPLHLDLTLTRAELESMVSDLIERTLSCCEKAIADAKMTKSEVDRVLLVGGQTRMPKVAAKLTDFFGKAPVKGVNPDEVVAMGAAIQGGVLGGKVKDIVLVDVTPLSIGVEIKGGIFHKLIDRNSTIPIEKKQVVSTAEDNQDFVRIHVLQGEREMAEDNKSLGTFELTGIPPAPKAVPKIEVTFRIDHNGILQVTARDTGTGQETGIRINDASSLQSDEVAAMIRDSEKYRESDRQRKRLVEEKNRAAGLAASIEKLLVREAEKIDARAKERFEDGLRNIQRIMEITDPARVEQVREGVSAIYAQVDEACRTAGVTLQE
ncbi:MAG: molecular chaperone DnaK [Acidobacteriota bacterium]